MGIPEIEGTEKTLKTNKDVVNELNGTFQCDDGKNWERMKDGVNGKIIKNLCISKEYQIYSIVIIELCYRYF